ncbi:hypothetical protein Ccrd_014461 [Cynara cardunculus var. scolymus]|uniref:Uncharacterized protein n=1 Tax=Cynara cardunculus var. scolymus TaxID=59895 RepID=A0A103YDN8_CYNCS|nr:hypothetical protein Ccrd_014461 [Cynara cardunculus var. scolymus]
MWMLLLGLKQRPISFSSFQHLVIRERKGLKNSRRRAFQHLVIRDIEKGFEEHRAFRFGDLVLIQMCDLFR